jgi:hypothetical protein
METRSQTNNNRAALYEVNIDFDEASEAWHQNKKQVSPGHFKYICTALKKDGTKCGNSCFKTNDRLFENEISYCWGHRGYNKNKNKDV